MASEQSIAKILKNLSDEDISLIKKGTLSDDEVLFLTLGIKSKISQITISSLYDKNVKILPIGKNIPAEVTQYCSIYKNYEGEPSRPQIKAKQFDFNKLSIVTYSYDTHHMYSDDHMDRDYGCKGQFEDIRILYDNELSAIYASCCSCHSAGPNKFYRFTQGRTDFLKVPRLNDQIIDSIDELLGVVKKKNSIEDIEKKTGMSKEQLLKILS